MKFKIISLALIASLNLSAFEPLSPDKAMRKFASDFLQINDYPLDPTMDYGSHTISPSFACYDAKDKYKFKKYSLEDFVCQSDYNSFRDNYFADLYNLIVKENPNLKEKAQKIARERIKDSKKECIRYSKKEYDYSFVESKALFVSESIGCISEKYRDFTAKLALVLYGDDKELFKRIYGEDYEKFKEVFEDTISISDLKFEGISAKQKEENLKLYENFEEKYKDYDVEDFGHNHYWDASYVLLVQYSLIDKNGHLVLPENRKEE
ncbi:hypothetical protein [Campylobacter concisus]|jgi:hypothetical protein